MKLLIAFDETKNIRIKFWFLIARLDEKEDFISVEPEALAILEAVNMLGDLGYYRAIIETDYK